MMRILGFNNKLFAFTDTDRTGMTPGSPDLSSLLSLHMKRDFLTNLRTVESYKFGSVICVCEFWFSDSLAVIWNTQVSPLPVSLEY